MSALDDLIARDAGSGSGGISALDALIARDSGGSEPAAPLQAAPVAAKSTPWDELTRQVGLTARAGLTGLTGLPAIAGNALNSGINIGIQGVNSLTGSHINPLQMPSAMVQHGMDSIGMPQPQNDIERTVQAASSAMAGVNPSVTIGRMLARSASPMSSAIGSGLTQLPGMQVAGAAGAGAAGEVAKQNGVGPWGQIGASVLGGALGAVAPSAGVAAVRGVRNTANNVTGIVQPIINPQRYVGQQLADALGGDASTVAENIRNAPQYVPGSFPTTAQAGQGGVLVATEKSAANANTSLKIALAEREAQNNAARWQALNGVAQTPEALAAAQSARDAVASPLYTAAHAQVATIDDGLMSLAQRPAMAKAMQTADQLAKNEGVSLQWPTPENPQISGQAVDYTNRALGDLIGTAQRSGSNQEVRALTGIQGQLKYWAEQNVPGVKAASQAYADHSVPVNTMEAGQQIADQLSMRAMSPTGQPMITPTSYNSALAKALKAQKYGIEPGAEASLNGIGKDLQRGTISNSLGTPGSDTAYNISADGWLARQLYGSDFGGASVLGKGAGALGATLTGHPMVGAGILAGGNKLGQTVGNRLNEQLSELLLHPKTLLPYLDAARKNSPQALAQILRGNVSQGAIGASTAIRPNP